ncbi:hypothetical protein HanRHA438_Chr04g0194021 [Helianthus annuus]|uniref:Uncharacterized protein n=1 Tax=Helianthus annuus TaxID=4232 RepID=A0A251TGP9_HELAN|nr:hypothetical protein HanXRQr2_Chr04g0184301 [Helianthus annuus]KAJ0582311.1 hypothetical protein HanHA300_Chr04g0150831 [Helianthus annuus]KAJ0590517.1 hypothetical protein HanIR_Chr04g0198321 [Helianthus annuus]KAJ0598284.1 hypothetical protein HanHA89_Chr04g0164111 [Helianthus annuus]KAJ0758917.1 hypothetical protein HanLR1_Chr04g0155691 [Helianthus annuus]
MQQNVKTYLAVAPFVIFSYLTSFLLHILIYSPHLHYHTSPSPPPVNTVAAGQPCSQLPPPLRRAGIEEEQNNFTVSNTTQSKSIATF